YLLDAGRLSGVGGELTKARVCSGGAFGAEAHVGTVVYVPCPDALVAVDIAGDRLSVTWRADVGHPGPPVVAGNTVWVVDVGGGQQLRALRWRAAEPEIVLLHGGAQNAHTWDTVALALDRPLLAIDLPGHGRSDWRSDHDYSPVTNAEAVAVVMDALAPDAELLVGMSLGGLTAIRVAARRSDLVRRLAIVDV